MGDGSAITLTQSANHFDPSGQQAEYGHRYEHLHDGRVIAQRRDLNTAAGKRQCASTVRYCPCLL
jgi:hypothetical protein